MSLRLTNLNYSYASKFTLSDIQIHFQKNLTAVIGPNGSGKSTLLKCIANILKSDAELYYEGTKIHRLNRSFFGEKMSYLPQSSQSSATITVFEAVLLGLINTLSLRISNAQTKAVDTLLDLMGLGALAHQKICELSGGQLQIVLLAQAIIKQPEILLLDEPLNNLDIHRQFALLNLVGELTRQKEMVTVIVMHDINLAARYADNIVVLENGKLYSQGAPKAVITREMLKKVYKVECDIHMSSQGYPVAEFMDIAANF